MFWGCFSWHTFAALRHSWRHCLCTFNWGGDATIQKGGLKGPFQLSGIAVLWVWIRSHWFHCCFLLCLGGSSGSRQRFSTAKKWYVISCSWVWGIVTLTGSVTFYFYSHVFVVSVCLSNERAELKVKPLNVAVNSFPHLLTLDHDWKKKTLDISSLNAFSL